MLRWQTVFFGGVMAFKFFVSLHLDTLAGYLAGPTLDPRIGVFAKLSAAGMKKATQGLFPLLQLRVNFCRLT